MLECLFDVGFFLLHLHQRPAYFDILELDAACILLMLLDLRLDRGDESFVDAVSVDVVLNMGLYLMWVDDFSLYL